ncbi:hypothetical protein [Tolumonas lignilytica]|uniref:hypothetical protein n=1 Tax=Tolumonas lignilytica TaxID=1283284 RepID=UPI000463E718|nr:hypothetical protein [Tolumonas lignilytica]
MVENQTKNILFIERFTNTNGFLFILGLIMYSDIYFSLKYNNETLSLVSLSNQQYIDVRSMIEYMLIFLFIHALFLPLSLKAFDKFYKKNSMNSSRASNYLVSLTELRDSAIIESNSAAYKHYENEKFRLEKIELLRKNSLFIFIMSILYVLLYLSKFTPLSTINELSKFASSSSNLSLVIYTSIAIFTVWIANNISKNSDENYENTFIFNYGSRLEKTWLNELTSGLIDKDEAIKNIRNIKASPHYGKSSFDADPEVSKARIYCEKHKLTYTEDFQLKLTPKANYFLRFSR